MIIQKIIFFLIVILLAPLSTASDKQTSMTNELTLIQQSRYLIYTSLITFPRRTVNLNSCSNEAPDIHIQLIKTHKGWKKALSKVGLLYNFFQFKLSANPQTVKEVVWEFSKEQYFGRENVEVSEKNVLVNVWQKFFTTVYLVCNDDTKHTIELLIDPEEHIIQQ